MQQALLTSSAAALRRMPGAAAAPKGDVAAMFTSELWH
jgi:hypothetical protein